MVFHGNGIDGKEILDGVWGARPSGTPVASPSVRSARCSAPASESGDVFEVGHATFPRNHADTALASFVDTSICFHSEARLHSVRAALAGSGGCGSSSGLRGQQLMLQLYRIGSSASFELHKELPVRWPAGVCSAVTAMDPDDWLEVGPGMCLGWRITFGSSPPLFDHADSASDSDNSCAAPLVLWYRGAIRVGESVIFGEGAPRVYSLAVRVESLSGGRVK